MMGCCTAKRKNAAMYEVVKTLHLISVFVFGLGMVVTPVLLLVASLGTGTVQSTARISKWFRLVAGSALFGLWGFGLTLALMGGWFGAGWLTVKLALVLALSGVHGALSGQLRRATAASHKQLLSLVATLLVVFTIVITLAIMKP